MSRFTRSFAVAIVRESVILSVPCRHLSLGEARAFCREYNADVTDRVAIVMVHPIARAIATARTKSRSS
jgi:hypothetical protein